MNKIFIEIEHIIDTLYKYKAVVLLIELIWVETIFIAVIVGDWWLMILDLLLNYLISKNYIRLKSGRFIIILIHILYLLYIWKPLTDGTIGNIIKEMIAK